MNPLLKSLLLLVISTGCFAAETQPVDLTGPTHPNVLYGPHQEQVLDFWIAESDQPCPLAIFIHGGGFQKGDKSSLGENVIRKFLDAGISVAAINYRMIPEWKLPTAHQDCKRALQFLRSRAKEWNIDPDRIGAFGGSAGAQLCMWLAFSPDMADKDSSDPLEHYSTRLQAVAPAEGQATMDFDLWDKWLPEIEKVSPNYSNANWTRAYSVNTWEEAKAIIRSISAIDLINETAPPVYMTYKYTPDVSLSADFSKSNSIRTHHVIFGLKLQEKLNAFGVENYLQYPGHPTPWSSYTGFLIDKLKQVTSR